ncbi:hypothetical protein SAY86_009673 [Trapa natans]|uniref:Uncharacterized protein n=1 Tax=Trapa natans TaxID=22666 RepID=A0AAN7QT19_TRANT|nr:hypothetical protein SAY86_009673 [Trapa natans]
MLMFVALAYTPALNIYWLQNRDESQIFNSINDKNGSEESAGGGPKMWGKDAKNVGKSLTIEGGELPLEMKNDAYCCVT